MKNGDLESKKCFVCSSPNIEIVYKRSLMPLGGQLVDFKDEFKPEVFYPLHHAICLDCSTFQTIESVPDNLLLFENIYFSGNSKTVIKRDHEVFLEIMKLYNFNSKNFVIEIGGSDGTFLENFLKENTRVLNIEPVEEAASIARKKGIDTLTEFLNEDIASKIVTKYGKADLIVIKQVLEVVPDLHKFLKSITMMLSENGRIMIESSYVKDILDCNFYSIFANVEKYHFSLTSLKKLLSINGLSIEKVIRYSGLEGGLRLYAGWKDKVNISDSVKTMLVEEKKWGVNKPKYYIYSFKKGEELKSNLLNLIYSIKKEGKKIVGYGAGIKASVLLNYCDLDNRYIDYLVDNGKHKQGKLIPGKRLPIYSPVKIDNTVDYILLLAWVHKDEIIDSLKSFTDRGGKIIIPTPEVEIYDSKSGNK